MSTELHHRNPPGPTAPPPDASFHTTRWTRVGQAKAPSSDGRRALAELCEAYYEPVAAFLRCELRDADAAAGGLKPKVAAGAAVTAGKLHFAAAVRVSSSRDFAMIFSSRPGAHGPGWP